MEHKKLQLVATEREIEVKKVFDTWKEIQGEFEKTKFALREVREDKGDLELKLNGLSRELAEKERQLERAIERENERVAEKTKEVDELNVKVKELGVKNDKLERDIDTYVAKITNLSADNEKLAARKNQLQSLNSKEYMQAQITKLRSNLEGLKRQRAETAASGKVGKDFAQIYQGFDQQEKAIEAQIQSLEFRLKNAK